MPFSASQKLLLVCLLAVLMPPAGAVEPRPVMPHPIPPNPPILSQLFGKAGYVFIGTVIAVQRVSFAGSREVSTVQITFHVQQGFRGVRTGETFSIHEWAGLWRASERYRRGDRALLFLYPQSKAGLTSPIGGSLGHFPLDGNGQVVLWPNLISVLSRDPQLQTHLRGKTRLGAGQFAHILLGMRE